MANFWVKFLDNLVIGLQLLMDEQEVFSCLIGDFNVYNLFVVYSVVVLLGQDWMEILIVLSEFGVVDGCFEIIVMFGKSYIGIVDYVYMLDVLEKVLQIIDQFWQWDSWVIMVVGCGGDWDKIKCLVMAKIVCVLSDQVILILDNFCSEDLEVILEDMWKGVFKDVICKVLMIVNWWEVIWMVVVLVQGIDIVLIVGKGYEKYQEIKGEWLFFDDKVELEGVLKDKFQWSFGVVF